ncbi:MAG TPA: hypothetical protein VFS43_03605 [Polyangiaceae bacterium]|nr:hypothetical protein [Polyangiaceae bacterium]
MTNASVLRRVRASLVLLSAVVLPALALGACADGGAGSSSGSSAGDATSTPVAGAGAVELLLGDPDSPVTQQVTVPGARNLRVSVVAFDNIVDDLFVRDGARTTIARLSDNDRDDGFLPYEIIVAGDTTFLTAGGLGAARVVVEDAGDVRPDNEWITDKFPAFQASRKTFRLPGAKGLRVKFELGVFFPEGSNGKVRLESEAGVLELGEEDTVQVGRGDVNDNLFRVPGDTVTISVDTLANMNFPFNITEDKALR